MTTLTNPQRMLFTFRGNGVENGRRLTEARAEHLENHEAPADDAEADMRSWFGAEDDVAGILEMLGFPALDIEGVLGALHVNKIATREIDVLPQALEEAGFAPPA